MMKKILLLALAIVCITDADGVELYDCGSTSRIIELIVYGCTASPCRFVVGNTYYMEATVESASYSDVLPFTIFVSVLGINIPITSGDSCNTFTVGSCPIYHGKTFTSRYYVQVPNLPPVPVRIRAEVRDSVNSLVLCGELDAQIVTS